jgi:hypothetical protein
LLSEEQLLLYGLQSELAGRFTLGLPMTPTDLDALALIDQPSAEAAYLMARARFDQSKAREPALDVALRCDGFAAAQHLSAKVAIGEKRFAEYWKVRP